MSICIPCFLERYRHPFQDQLEHSRRMFIEDKDMVGARNYMGIKGCHAGRRFAEIVNDFRGNSSIGSTEYQQRSRFQTLDIFSAGFPQSFQLGGGPNQDIGPIVWLESRPGGIGRIGGGNRAIHRYRAFKGRDKRRKAHALYRQLKSGGEKDQSRRVEADSDGGSEQALPWSARRHAPFHNRSAHRGRHHRRFLSNPQLLFA